MRTLITTCFCISIVLSCWQKSVIAAPTGNLRFGVHPYLSTVEIKHRFTPLVTYLTRELETPVTLQISKDYESHITLTGTNSLDISYLGPSSYVTLTQRYGKRPILGRLEVNGKPFFHGYIITRNNSGIDSLQALLGKRFAFTSSGSTMGYRVPKYILHRAGIELEQLGEQKFLGNHDNVALGVLVGDFDAGAVKEEVYAKYRDKGLRKLAKSADISEHLFVCSAHMPVEKIKKIRQALYKLSETAAGIHILHSIKPTVTNIVPGVDKNYHSLRQIMK